MTAHKGDNGKSLSNNVLHGLKYVRKACSQAALARSALQSADINEFNKLDILWLGLQRALPCIRKKSFICNRHCKFV